MSEKFIIDKNPADSDAALLLQENLTRYFENAPIPRHEMIDQLSLFTSLPALRRFLYFDRLYQQIRHLPGHIFVFGVRWGRDLATWQVLRDLFDSHYHARKIVGFDTFEGFPSVSDKDAQNEATQVGAYSVTSGYENFLAEVLKERERLTRFPHMDRTVLVKGDAPAELERYLKEHPETAVALAYFDMDIYQPTRDCAKLLQPYLVQGAVVAFDELMLPSFPGETVAAREIFGTNLPIQRFEVSPSHGCYMTYRC
jgi:hypothetical protein